jgi:galactonate dehydratase
MTNRQIAKIETFLVPPRWLFVRVESDDGAFGWGEASLEGWAEAVNGVFEGFRDRFIGVDPYDIEDIWQVGYRGGFYRGGAVLMSALAGLEQALWDLKGRSLDLPVWQMLGGKVRNKVRSYAWIGGDRPHEIAEAAAARKKQGFTAVKMNATAELDWIGTPKLFDDVVKRVEAAQAQGMDVGLDFHGRVHRPLAKQLAKALEPLGLLFIEEPLLSENMDALPEIAAHTTTPIALGERLYSRSSSRARSTSFSRTSAMPAESSKCGRSRRWPRRTTLPLRRTARWGRSRSAPASRSPPARPTMRSRRSAWAFTTTLAGTTC